MTNSKVRAIGIAVISISTILKGQTIISGDISKFVLDSANNPFIVEKDIEVPANKKVIVNEGCVFLFKEFTGFKIEGSFLVNGTQTHPVIFTTIKDSLYNNQNPQAANPFDWNGILIGRTAAAVQLNNFKLMYSVYGIKSQKKDIIIKNGDFKANGQFNFTVFDKIQYVQENLLYSYPDDSAMVDISPQKTDQTTLSIASIPSSAEIYINKKPGKRTIPDGRTPATLKKIEHTQLILTLFKKGYSDTTISLSINSNKANSIEIALNTISNQSIDAQNRLLRDRFHVQLGRYCFISSPLFLITGAGFLYYAGKNYQKADDAQDFLKKSILPPTDPRYRAAQRQNNDETRKGDAKRNASIAFFCIGAISLGAGIYLYF